MTIEQRIAKLTAELETLRRRRNRRPRVVQKASDRGRGRPAIGDDQITIARELARVAPIADVAFKLGVNRSTLYRYGITRQALDREARKAAVA